MKQDAKIAIDNAIDQLVGLLGEMKKAMDVSRKRIDLLAERVEELEHRNQCDDYAEGEGLR